MLDSNKIFSLNILILFVFITFGFTHKFYVSVSRIKHIESNNSLQITSKIFIDDIQALFNLKHPRLNLNTDSENITIDIILKNYFNDVFKIRKGSNYLKYNFLGKEYIDDMIVCYIELPNIMKNDTLIIQNTILIELFDSQKNILHVEGKIKNKSFLLSNNLKEIQVILNQD
jgi:hypothetical protein